jgi:hypothetical protein
VERGLRWLTGVQKADGDLGGGMYAHALAARALCQAYRLTSDPALKAPAQRALDYIVKAQHDAGGWRYAPGMPGDTSVTAWQVLALDEGVQAGLAVPRATLKRAGAYLDSVAVPGGAFAYVPGAGAGSPAMRAAGLLSRLRLGLDPRHADALKSAEGLVQNLPAPGPGPMYHYHFATLALERVGGAEWQAWEPRMRRVLLDSQSQGPGPGVRGTWDFSGDPIARCGGRTMATSLALSVLQSCARRDPPRGVEARERTEKELQDLLISLGVEDFWEAREGMRALIASAGQAVPLVKEALRPPPPADAARVARLVTDLDAEAFAAREKAAAELERLGPLARPALERAARTSPSAEVKRRAEALLAAIAVRLAGEDRRALRAVEVLVQAGTRQARDLLRELAGGPPEAALTREARAGLERLGPGRP